MNSRQTQDCRLDSLPLWRRNRQATARYFILFLFLSIALVGISGSLWAQNEGNPEFAYTATGSCSCEGQGSIPGSVSAYTIDGTTGVLTQIPGSPFPAGQNSHSVVADPTGQFLYVANHDSNDVSAYIIDGTSGALTPIAGSPLQQELVLMGWRSIRPASSCLWQIICRTMFRPTPLMPRVAP